MVAATAGFIAAHGGNIIHAEQHVDGGVGHPDAVFFQRIEFDLVRPGATNDMFAE